MKIKLKTPLATAIAIGVGLVVLLGYFFSDFIGLRQIFLQWAVTLAAIALVIGAINLLSVHSEKINEDSSEAIYSGVVVFSLLATFILTLTMGPSSTWSQWVFQYIQIPIEGSLMAVLAVSLAYASARLLRRRLNNFSIIFVVTVLLVLLGTGPFLTYQIPFLNEIMRDVRAWVAQVPAAAGARGILIGVGLGTVATGIRILMGADRPYGG